MRRWPFPSWRHRQNPRRDGDLRKRRSVGTLETGEERTASDVDFFRALVFLTILPCPRQESSPEDMGRSSGWFPAVGAVLGVILAAADAGLSRCFPLAASSAVVVLWAFLTRGFHLDGLADTFDGIGGGYSRESRLCHHEGQQAWNIRRNRRRGSSPPEDCRAGGCDRDIPDSGTVCRPCRRKVGDPLRHEIFSFSTPRRDGRHLPQRMHECAACHRYSSSCTCGSSPIGIAGAVLFVLARFRHRFSPAGLSSSSAVLQEIPTERL